jgi:AcrR family transcriptional regulator
VGDVTMPSSGRARPLPPDERRAALVEATLPLVARYGMKVTTRQIAEAAEVAEGTIFRVFPDKEALVRAALDAALDPEPVLEELSSVDTALPLRPRLLAVTSILQRRPTMVFGVLIAVRLQAPPDVEGKRAEKQRTDQPIYVAVERLLEPDRAAFDIPLSEVTRLLRLLTFAGTHPMITENQPLTADEIVSVLLDGVLRHENRGHPC